MYHQKIMEAACAIIVFDAVYADFEVIKNEKFEIVFCYLENALSQWIGDLLIFYSMKYCEFQSS